MSEHYFEVSIRVILDDYMKRRLAGSDVLRLPLTGQPVYDEWIDLTQHSIMFRIFDATEQENLLRDVMIDCNIDTYDKIDRELAKLERER